MLDMQKLVNAMNDVGMRERSGYEMTLGRMIEALEKLPQDAMIRLDNPHSYRGYYSDLAWEVDVEPRLVSEVMEDARDCVGREFTGYKGGEYLMDTDTPVWISDYGNATGERLRGFRMQDHFDVSVVGWMTPDSSDPGTERIHD